MLYESLSYLLIFSAVYIAYWKTAVKKAPGRVLGLVLAFSFAARFLVEFIKQEQVPFEYGMPLNMGQLLSLPFILVGLALLGRPVETGSRPL